MKHTHGIITDILVKMLEETKQTAINHLNWGSGAGSIMSGILGAIYDNGFEEQDTETIGNTLMRNLLYFHIREAIPVFYSQYKNIEDLDKAAVKNEIETVLDFAIKQAKKKISI